MRRRPRRSRRYAGRSTDDVLRYVAEAVIRRRRAAQWTQRQLGDRADVSQSEVSDIEHARLPELPVGTIVRLVDALGAHFSIRIESADLVDDRRQVDPAHAATSAYVSGNLRNGGWDVRAEVEIGAGSSRGWIDLLAWSREASLLLVIEIKTEIRDLGAIQRQLGWYEREARPTAASHGWHPTRVVGCLLLLDSEANATAVRRNRPTFDQESPVRARELTLIVEQPASGGPAPWSGDQALAMVDPRSRRARWLRTTAIDRRRSAPAYRDYADFVTRAEGQLRRYRPRR